MSNWITATTRELVDDFNSVLGTSWHPPKDIRAALACLLAQFVRNELKGIRERKRILIALTNWKFRFNSSGISNFLDECAGLRLFFNYHDKQRIQSFFDYSDAE